MVLRQPTNSDFSELACCVRDVYCSVQTVIYLHCCCCYFFFIALDAAVTSFPQRTNILFLFF